MVAIVDYERWQRLVFIKTITEYIHRPQSAQGELRGNSSTAPRMYYEARTLTVFGASR
jgi:hypothetical protein